MKTERVSIMELVEDALEFVRQGAEKKRISISRGDFPANLCVQGNRDYLGQVFVNLLDDAIKYTTEGGSIEVSVVKKASRSCFW